MYQFHFEVVWHGIGDLLAGASLTVLMSLLAMLFGSLIGIVTCFAKLSRARVARSLATAYVQIMRGTPLLVQLLWIYYGLPIVTGIALGSIVSGAAGLSLNAGAYLSEIFRSGLLAVERGQYEAARSIGMSHFMALRRIIAPQAFRVIIPPLANHFIGLVKDTSLVSVIAVPELVRRGQLVAAATFRTMEAYTGVALIYFVMTYVLARISAALEARFSRGVAERSHA